MNKDSGSQELSSEYSDSEQQIPADLAREDHNFVANHNTQASFLQDNKEIFKILSTSFTELIKQLVETLRVDKSQHLSPFISYLSKNKKHIEIEILKNQSFDLDCIPIFILVNTKVITLPELYKMLRDENFSASTALHMDEKKIPYKNYITFQPDTKEPFYFKIKELPLYYDKNKEADMLVDKLFEFHLNTVEGFNDFASYIFFWANCRKILSEKYIPVSVLKIILILFLSIINVPSLIQSYLKKYKSQLDSVDEYIEIGPKGTQIANKQQINKFPNTLLEIRRGFFLKSENAYDESCIIRKICFPILQIEIDDMKNQLKQKSSAIFSSKSIGEWIYIFFKFARTKLMVDKTFIIDLAESKGKIWENKPDADATLIVLHPVFGYNMTEHLKKSRKKGGGKDDDYEVICKEFTRAFDFIKDGDWNDLVKITDQYLD